MPGFLKSKFRSVCFWLVITAGVLLLPSVGMGSSSGVSNIGKPAINFTLSDKSGKSYSLNQYRGKVILIEFFGHSCGACLEVASEVADFVESFNSPDVVFLKLEVWGAVPVQIERYIRNSEITEEHPILLEGTQMQELYEIETRNNYIVIGRDFNIEYNSSLEVSGYADGWRKNEVKAVIDAELKKTTSLQTPVTVPGSPILKPTAQGWELLLTGANVLPTNQSPAGLLNFPLILTNSKGVQVKQLYPQFGKDGYLVYRWEGQFHGWVWLPSHHFAKRIFPK